MLARTAQKSAAETIVVDDEQFEPYRAGEAFARESARSRTIIVWFAVDIIIAAPTCGYAMWTEWRWVSLVIGGLLGAILGERYLRFRHPG